MTIDISKIKWLLYKCPISASKIAKYSHIKQPVISRYRHNQLHLSNMTIDTASQLMQVIQRIHRKDSIDISKEK